jgi:hypothetical protein
MRYFCSQLVKLNFLGRRQTANLEEIGEDTAVVLSERPVPLGAKLRIDCGMHTLEGIAGACTFDTVLGFFVHIRLDRASRWSPRRFAPRHLLLRPTTDAKAIPLAMASGY